MDDNKFHLENLYRNVFGSHEGHMVLSHILFESGFFDVGGRKENFNTCARILEILGNGRVDVRSTAKLIEGLIGQSRVAPLPLDHN